MKYKLPKLMLLLTVITGCASTYKPSENIIQMKNKMSLSQASKIIKQSFMKPDRIRGICKANGVDGGGLTGQTWRLDNEKPEISITSKGISFNAYQIVKSYSTSGNIATQGAAGLTTTASVAARKNIRKSFTYSEIDQVTLHPESGMMTRRCYRPDGHTEIVIELNQGFGHWFAIVLKNNDVEKFIAALMMITPNTPIKTS